MRNHSKSFSQPKVSVQKQAFFVNQRDKFSYDAILNEEMPLPMQRELADVLQIKPFPFSKEADVRKQCLETWNKDWEDLNEGLTYQRVIGYTRNEEGRLERVDMQGTVDKAMRLLGRDFHRLSAEDKKKRIEKVQMDQEMERMREFNEQNNDE